MRVALEISGHLRAEFGYGAVTEITELYRTVAATCINNQVNRVLIVVGDDEPAGERALREALTTVILAGMPERFRLALVAASPGVAQTYRNTPRDCNAAEVATQLFENEDDAVRWLAG